MSHPPPPETTTAPAPLMTCTDIAATLRVTVRTVDLMRAAGRFPGPDLIVSRRPRWLASTVQSWIASQAGR